MATDWGSVCVCVFEHRNESFCKGKLTSRMTPVGGIVVTVALFAVAVATVFGADNVCLLECRTGRGVEQEGRRRSGQGVDIGEMEREEREEIGSREKGGKEGETGKSAAHEIQSRWPSKGSKLDVTHGM